MAGSCYLWSDLPTATSPCSDCYSGPSDCAGIPTTTVQPDMTQDLIFITGGIGQYTSTELVSLSGAITPITVDLPDYR